MTASWAFAESLWHKHFAPLRAAGFSLERTDSATYWREHEALLRSHFPPETHIGLAGLRDERAREGQARIAEATGAARLEDFCFVRDGDTLVATFCGHHQSADCYRMWHTNVHRDHRRRGIYKGILAATIAYTAELGYDRILSDHAPGNNPILIAKLGAGFRITGMTVMPAVGTSIVLEYFHNPDHLAAYEFRCGLATINPRILAHGNTAMKQLASQFQAAERDT